MATAPVGVEQAALLLGVEVTGGQDVLDQLHGQLQRVAALGRGEAALHQVHDAIVLATACILHGSDYPPAEYYGAKALDAPSSQRGEKARFVFESGRRRGRRRHRLPDEVS